MTGFCPDVVAIHDLLGNQNPCVFIFADEAKQNVITQLAAIDDPALLVRPAHEHFLHLQKKSGFPLKERDDLLRRQGNQPFGFFFSAGIGLIESRGGRAGAGLGPAVLIIVTLRQQRSGRERDNARDQNRRCPRNANGWKCFHGFIPFGSNAIGDVGVM